jgi:predicted nucleic acid-binding protein
MNAFVDSSVLLRLLFGEANPLGEWPRIEEAYASRLLVVEIGRVIDRVRLEGAIDDEQVAQLHEELRRLLKSIEILTLTEDILRRAEGSLPTVLCTLDALHLPTALELVSALGRPVTMATHEVQLARASRAFGLTVCGV